MNQVLVIGAGTAGLSAAWHAGNSAIMLLEQASKVTGHATSHFIGEATWDEGPHVSFTKDEYVRDLLAKNVNGEFAEIKADLGNYWYGHWIKHPAQLHLYSVPEPLRSKCVESFLENDETTTQPLNYGEWLDQAMGKVFADEFARRYTRKYWTVEAEELTTEWIGVRVHRPSRGDFLTGAAGPIEKQGHYIQLFRYPTKGGFQRYIEPLATGKDVRLNTRVARIDLAQKVVYDADGRSYKYERLVNTMPLPVFMESVGPLPPSVREAVKTLRCSKLLLVNVLVSHEPRRIHPWIYVYNEEMLSTRITQINLLSSANTPPNKTGIQVEVYLRSGVNAHLPAETIQRRVVEELKQMGLLDEDATWQAWTVPVSWANVVFTHDTKSALNCIWSWLERFGLEREPDDLHPLTNWNEVDKQPRGLGQLIMAGRFGQWKYFWTDDCILRGKQIGMQIRSEAE